MVAFTIAISQKIYKRLKTRKIIPQFCGKKLLIYLHTAALFKTSKETDYRSGQGIKHKAAKQGYRRVNRGKDKDQYHR